MITPPCEVESPSRAAGFPPIITVADPLIMVAGGPAQTHESPTRAAGKPPMSTTGAPPGSIGPPTCGVPPGVTPGQTCWSVIRAIGFIVSRSFAPRRWDYSNSLRMTQTDAGEHTRLACAVRRLAEWDFRRDAGNCTRGRVRSLFFSICPQSADSENLLRFSRLKNS